MVVMMIYTEEFCSLWRSIPIAGCYKQATKAAGALVLVSFVDDSSRGRGDVTHAFRRLEGGL